MNMLQLNPPIHVMTPLGEGDCLVIMDYGVHVNSVWLVWIFDSGRVSHFDSSDIRVMGNLMYGIPHPEPPGSPLTPVPAQAGLGWVNNFRPAICKSGPLDTSPV